MTIVEEPIVKVFHPTRILSSASSSALLSWVDYSLNLGARHLLVDLADVSFMDSSGMGSLIVAFKQVQKAKGSLALCALNGQARMLFELAAMDQIFPIYANAEEYRTAVLGDRSGGSKS